MTEKEIKVMNRIPKKYRAHIVNLQIVKSGCLNEHGRELNDYIVMWDNDDEHVFNSIEEMIFLIREYSLNGYYIAP